MKEVRICFRITIDGEEPLGMALMLDGIRDDVTYEELAKNVNKTKVLELTCLDGVATPDQMEIITQEQFEEEFCKDDA